MPTLTVPRDFRAQSAIRIPKPHSSRAVERLVRGPLRAGELAQALDLPVPTMSRHLRALTTAPACHSRSAGSSPSRNRPNSSAENCRPV